MTTETYATSAQERQIIACRSMMATAPLIPLTIVDEFEPLEKTRMFGPFSIEVIAWCHKLGNLVTMGWDADGREYIEY